MWIFIHPNIEHVATMRHAGLYFSLSGTHFNVCVIRAYSNVWVYLNKTSFQTNEPIFFSRYFVLDGAVVVTIKSDFCVHMRTLNISIFIRDSESCIPCNYSVSYTLYTQMKPNTMELVLRG